MKNDAVVIEQHHPIPATSLVKSSMSRPLVHRTNKEFDKCAELLRNILSVQESRRNSKLSSTIGKTSQKSQQLSPSGARPKQQSNKASAVKLSFIKTNVNGGVEVGERRSSYSPNKSLLSTTTAGVGEEQPLLKNRTSPPNKSRKHLTRSPSSPIIIHQRGTSPSKTSPLLNNKFRHKSSSSPSPSRRPLRTRRRRQQQQQFVRSSSCGDLPSSKLTRMNQQQTRVLVNQFLAYLTRIRTIAKQIRTRSVNSIGDTEISRLWTELDNSLVCALAYANDDIQLQLTLEPLRNEIVELRKQLQTANVHLQEFDTIHRSDEQYVQLKKKFDHSQVQCTQLLLHNHELKMKCNLLQEKLSQIERNNLRLIQRWTQQDLRSLAQRTAWIDTDNRFLLREEIILLKQKLYHLYDDLATILNRNSSLEMSISEQQHQLTLYKQQLNEAKQSAQHLLGELDSRSTEERIKRFLTNMLVDHYSIGISTNTDHQSHVTPTKTAPSAVTSCSFLFETPHKAPAAPPASSRSRASPAIGTSKLRPKSLFVTPTVLNDANALSKLQQQNRSPTFDVIVHTPSSSSTIYDADSTLTSSSSSSLTSSFYHQQRKRMTLYNSLPTLAAPPPSADVKTTIHKHHHHHNNNESGAELDQISDLTSKMFSSEDENDDEDVGIGISGTSSSSSSSSTMPSDAERLMLV